MNTFTVSILIAFSIIGFLTLCISIYLAIIGKKNSNAFNQIWFNTLKCYPNIECPITITDFPVPTPITEDYSTDLARYCAYLIVRIYQASNTKSKIIEPKNIKNEMIFYNIDNGLDKLLPFGVIWSDKSSDILFIAFRGTMKLEEWFKDLSYSQNNFIQPEKKSSMNQQKAIFLRNVENPPKIHGGFLEVYFNLREKLLAKIDELKPKQIIITGHSLGAAISTICALDLKLLNYDTIVYNFASPRVGDQNLSNLITTKNLPIYNMINTLDIIPTLPPAVAPNFTKGDDPFLYSDYGIPVRFSDNWKSNVNNHLMGVYVANIQV